MSDLKSDYRHIEEDITWPEKPKGIGGGNQFYRLAMDLRGKVRERSLAGNLEPDLYEARLYKLLDFVSDLRSALNDYSIHTPEEKKDQQRIWYHRADDQLTGMGEER